jgi:integrase
MPKLGRPLITAGQRVCHVLEPHKRRGLLQPDDPHHDLQANRERPLQLDQQRPRTALTDLDAERRNRHLQRAVSAALDTLPEPMAGHLHTWVRVLRGQGRRRHRRVGYERIRRYVYIALPVLRGWADTGVELRQVTAAHIHDELGRRHGSQARDLHHVLRTLFAALKQERLVFHNPMTGISLRTPVRVPVPLPTDRLRGLLDDLDSPRARLLVALVAIHGLRPLEVTRLRFADVDLTRLIIRVPRGAH